MFALRHKATGKMVGFYTSSNGGDFCVSTEFSLQVGADNLWVVFDRATAEKAAVTHTEWYNAGYETPANSYVGGLEVVELVIKT